MENVEQKRYGQRFNLGLVIHIDHNTHKYLIHIGFCRIKYFFSSSTKIKIGDYVVFDLIQGDEVEYVDVLTNYKFIDTTRGHLIRNWEDGVFDAYVDREKEKEEILKKAQNNLQAGYKSIFVSGVCSTGYYYKIIDRIEEKEHLTFPSQETKLLLHALYPPFEPYVILDSAFFDDTYAWATKVVNEYDFEGALESVKVNIGRSSQSISRDSNGEYFHHAYFYLDYLHHNKRSSYHDRHEIHDSYLEKTVFPDIDIDLSYEDDRDSIRNWINPQYPNPDNWENDAEKIEQEIRNRAMATYDRTKHISSLACEKIQKRISASQYVLQVKNKIEIANILCWEHGSSVLKENSHLDRINSTELEKYNSRVGKFSEKLRKLVFSNILGLIGWRSFD